MVTKNEVVILGLDTFKHKNINQIKLMNESGYNFTVFTNDAMGDSKERFAILSSRNSLKILDKKLFTRIFQVFGYLKQNKSKIHHVELYPIGRFAIFYILIIKALNIKSLSILRGIALRPENFDCESWLYKLSVKYSFLWANHVWYKEPYMEHDLKRLNVKNTHFLPNAVELPKENESVDKEIDFLWVNRIIKERYFDWVIEYFYRKGDTSLSVLGSLGERDVIATENRQRLHEMKETEGFDFHGFIDPMAYYQRASFFLLPTEIVFGNFALLEAMSYGVIPIVSNTEATKLIVEHGVNGLVFDNNKESFFKAVENASGMSIEQRKVLSQNAKETIRKSFSLESHRNSLLELYGKLN